jgi:DNA-binding XRE family transcriptional regulator
VEKLAANLKYLREKFNFKQSEMQAQLDIKRTTWLKYEKGSSQPYLK